jgi:hypothetical protein
MTTTILMPNAPRTLCHLDTDKQWAGRDTHRTLHCTAVDAANRLRGLANVLCGIGLQRDFIRFSISCATRCASMPLQMRGPVSTMSKIAASGRTISHRIGRRRARTDLQAIRDKMARGAVPSPRT